MLPDAMELRVMSLIAEGIGQIPPPRAPVEAMTGERFAVGKRHLGTGDWPSEERDQGLLDLPRGTPSGPHIVSSHLSHPHHPPRGAPPALKRPNFRPADCRRAKRADP